MTDQGEAGLAERLSRHALAEANDLQDDLLKAAATIVRLTADLTTARERAEKAERENVRLRDALRVSDRLLAAGAA